MEEKIVTTGTTQRTTEYLTFLYNGEGPTGFVYNNTVYTYRKNLFGDIIAVYNGTSKVAEYAYDAYGNCRVITGSNIGTLNPFRYRGYYFDEDMKLYYLQSRYYDPETGRFINADDVSYLDPESIHGLNLYTYCLNNPVMYIDETGHFVDFILDIFFIGWDIYNLRSNDGWKDWKNWVALGVDIVFAVVPFVTGGGGQIVKLANVSDDISDFTKITVVGETMTRVQTVSQFFNATDNLYDGFKSYGKLVKEGKYIRAELFGKMSNAAWLYGKLRKGYTVIDIGIDIGRTSRSSSYILEKIVLNIWKYRNAWKLPYHLY